jgi:long-subunit acyl-CoA synthetase (AMP-forming)
LSSLTLDPDPAIDPVKSLEIRFSSLVITIKITASLFQERLENQAMNQPCLLVYTSGTTGNPKGVMVSQAWPFFT